MKKMMMFALIASCTSTAFADLPQIIFEGKSIDPTDNRTSLIKKNWVNQVQVIKAIVIGAINPTIPFLPVMDHAD